MTLRSLSRILLHVDDSPEDRAACRRVLAAHLPDWKLLEAGSGEAALALLKTERPDCILLDYHLPDMNGLEVLAALGDSIREVAVIAATGQGDEAVAVAALKAGARDYLTKDTHGLWLKLLPGRIERAVSEHRHELHELRAREARMRLLLESSGDGIYGIDPGGRCIFANRACVTMLGYASADELLGNDMHVLIHPDHAGEDSHTADCPLATSWRIGVNAQREDDVFRRRNGTVFPVDYTSFPMRDETGSLLGAVVSFRDISERKRNEARLARLTRTYAVLSGCNHDLVHATSEPELVERFCRNLIDTGGYAFAWIGLGESNAPESLRVVAYASRTPDPGARLCTASNMAANLPTLARRACMSGQTIVARISADNRCFTQCGPLADCSHSAVAALPLQLEGNCMGVLVIYALEADAFDAQGMALLQELAGDLAFGLVGLRSQAARAQAETALHLRDQAIQAASNGIMIVTAGAADLSLLYANPAFEKITGYALDEALGCNPATLLAGEDSDQPGLAEIRSALKQRKPASALLYNFRKDGTPFWNELHLAPVRDPAGTVNHYVGIVNDVSERVRHEKELEYHASYDGLTGLPNRHLLEDRLTQALGYAERHQRACAVLFMDLDRFKLVNDSLGHHAGDELLKVIAARLAACGRNGDTVARYGGDEFVMILPDLPQADEMDQIASRLLAAVAKPVMLLGEELRLTVSIGAAVYPRHGREPETLMRCADIAMFRAKDAGGNSLRRFSSEMGTQLSERLRLERDLRHGLEHGEVFPHFQPQIDLADRRLIGMEALARWQHPERGMLPPALFIPVAEETGLILQLGEQILEQVCRQVTQWRHQGLTVPTVSVNLSPHQLALPDLERRVAGILERTGMDAAGLDLEVTEGALMCNPEQALAHLRRLKELGIELSLDDFGTGYSSLAYLKRFPFDLLKIDQSFVHDLPDDSNDAAIALTIINMARSLGLKVVAEGVETEAQHEFLHRYACDYGQGWLYGKPMPAQAMADRLAGAG